SHPSAHLFVITGEEALRRYSLINLSTDQGVAKLLSYLTEIGVDEELAKMGASDGDAVRIGEFEFEYVS
ncbi:MAG: Obg family GTPase CgtA, partial [Firmicutes bacterium]|nr:Obg family GTPase CgtA [Candidatus Enteromonas pullistercoris]